MRRSSLWILTVAVLALALAPAPAPPRDDDPTSAKAKASIARAFQWLHAAQNHDGSFGDDTRTPGQVGNTCIAVLAMLATGDTLTCGTQCLRIRRAVDWVRARVRNYGGGTLDSGTLLQGKLGENVAVYLAALLYSQILGLGVSPQESREMQDELGRMTARIAALQKPSGEWETSYEPMLTTVFAWLALRQAHDAGVTVHGASAEKALQYLERTCFDKQTGAFREAKWGKQVRFVSQAGALRVLYGMDKGNTPMGQQASKLLLTMRYDQDVGGATGGEEFLAAVLATQAFYFEREGSWRQWFPRIVNGLTSSQNKDGSWFGRHCITGRVFCTACSALTMLTPEKMLPMVEK